MLWIKYDADLKLDNHSKESEEELHHLILFVSRAFDVHDIEKADMYDPAVIEICTKVRTLVFKQLKKLSFWTIFFAVIELGLYFTGRYAINPYSLKGEVITCPEPTFIYWAAQNIWGGLFCLAHAMTLTLSAAAIIRMFYLLPKKEGLIMKFEFNLQNQTEDYLSRTSLVSQRFRKSARLSSKL